MDTRLLQRYSSCLFQLFCSYLRPSTHQSLPYSSTELTARLCHVNTLCQPNDL